MAINTLNYTVTADGVIPNYERRAGVQYDHNKTQLQFTLDSALYDSLLKKLAEGSLSYRLDIVDGEGNQHLGEVKSLDGITLVPFPLSYWVTKFGGKLRACLVITLTSSSTTTIEFSCETVLSLDNLPECNTTDDSYKSLTTLSEQTANYAKTVKEIKSEIIDLYRELDEMKAMLDCGEWVFDGNSELDINFIIDTELDKNSKNAVSNSAVSEKITLIENEIQNVSENIGQNMYDSIFAQMRNELMLSVHPIGSYYWSSDPTNPQNLFGGVWQQVKDVFVLAAGDNYSVGSTGGEAKHKLTSGEMPKHGHAFKSDYNADGENFVVPTKLGGSGISHLTSGTTAHTPAHWANSTWGTTQTGGNMAHNNMPPYVVAYCFKRIG